MIELVRRLIAYERMRCHGRVECSEHCARASRIPAGADRVAYAGFDGE
jgi:hypothetical protein